jgi:hypothetical protein
MQVKQGCLGQVGRLRLGRFSAVGAVGRVLLQPAQPLADARAIQWVRNATRRPTSHCQSSRPARITSAGAWLAFAKRWCQACALAYSQVPNLLGVSGAADRVVRLDHRFGPDHAVAG